MTQLGLMIVWCVIQVTIVAAVAGVCYALVRRRGPVVSSAVVLTGLTAIVVLTLMSASPWPSWRSLTRFQRAAAEPGKGIAAAPAELAPQTASRGGSEAIGMGAFIEAFWSELRAVPNEAAGTAAGTAAESRWPAVVVAVFVLGVALGGARMLAGMFAVRACYTKSTALENKQFTELIDILRAEMNCRRGVELRQSSDLSTAATIGWRRPVILLPTHWPSWNESERRAVLAHELAHIHHRDYPTWAWAQLGLMLHFYHPLVHWLVGWLRLDQELAADAVAARFSGGSRSYLATLAELALRHPDRPLGWPARCFLPTRRTFLRRIEMLRDRKQMVSATPGGTRTAAIATVLLAGVLSVGLRPGPFGAAEGIAAEEAESPKGEPVEAGSSAKPFTLAYVPRDAIAVTAMRPSSLLAQPSFRSIAAMFADDGGVDELLGVGLRQIEQATIVIMMDQSGKASEPAVTIVRLVAPQAATDLVGKLVKDAEPVEFGGQSYLRGEGGRRFVFRPDAQTLVLADSEGYLRRAIVAGDAGAEDVKWAPEWRRIADADAAALLNVSMLSADLTQQVLDSHGSAQARLAVLAPLWKNIATATLAVKVESQLTLDAQAEGVDGEQARVVEETLAALITLGKNSLSQFRRAVSDKDEPDTALKLHTLDVADRALEQAIVSRSDKRVTLKLSLDGADTTQIVKTLVPAVTAARKAARRAISMNSLKQLSLAMHVYHEQRGHFPPAVLLGPDGQTPHSWRVELLPFLEREDLYRQYRMNEPWDSESNRKVLAQMPSVYSHPAAQPGGQNTAYFAITGPDTVFAGQGTAAREIRDGLSNTIMLVEAKRDVPWTKPVDIVYAPDAVLPALGGYHSTVFLVAFCDAAVMAVSHDIDEQTLRNMITIADGQFVDLDVRPKP